MSGRYVPVPDIDLGDAVLVEKNLISADIEFAVTEKVPAFALQLNDANQKYSNGSIMSTEWNDAMAFSLNGTLRFLGRVDAIKPEYSKETGRILNVTGRHTGSAALQDYVTNLQVSGTPNAIVAAIIARYTSMRGTTYTADPEITIITNNAPDDITLEFDWRRKNLWKMLDELQQALAAPVAEGGKDSFYDFFLNPATVGDFYFVPMGSLASAVTIPLSTETLKAKPQVIDALPMKNDIWVWCNAIAGAVPFEMQEGYNGNGITDPWTEGNASDYAKYAGAGDTPTVEDYPNPPSPTGEDRRIGSECVRIYGVIPAQTTSTEKQLYWSMKFAHGEAFHEKLAGFTNQDPEDMLNLTNESHMAESMGEVSAISFYLKTLSSNWPMAARCIDVDDKKVSSGLFNSKATTGIWRTTQWDPKVIPIGPSSEAWKPVTAADDYFDWAAVKEIRFLAGGQSGYYDFLFDGFKFVKPLIANAAYVSSTAREKTLRSEVIAKEKIENYLTAHLIAEAILEQKKNPNRTWQFENIGRDDIPSGYTFTFGTTLLLMRDQRWNMTKQGGWIMSATALEQT